MRDGATEMDTVEEQQPLSDEDVDNEDDERLCTLVLVSSFTDMGIFEVRGAFSSTSWRWGAVDMFVIEYASSI